MKKATILFPHQLFKNVEVLPKNSPVYLVEETLFFNQYNFHKQKLLFHRSSMKFYEQFLTENGFEVHYIDAKSAESDIRILVKSLIKKGLETLYIINPTDNWLEKHIKEVTETIEVIWHENPLFLNTKDELAPFFKPTKKKFFQTSFYKEQRKKRAILVENGNPTGGKWTFDAENRKKYPRGKNPPVFKFPDSNSFYEEAFVYINKNFGENIGEISISPIYPTTFSDAENWLQIFLETRFLEFGDFEDAIVKDKHFLNHSVLSPMLNVGLLSVSDVVAQSLEFARKNAIPINSLEGFIRQIIGWREFIRGVYEVKGTEERTRNFWEHSRKIPKSFYDGTTGIEPIDATIKKVLKTGYAHHIERLMILGNFMTLCEFHPDEVYRAEFYL